MFKERSEVKVCCRCNKSKNVSEFYWHKRFQKYYYSCKECHQKNVRQRELRIEDKIKQGDDVKKYSKTESGKKRLSEATKRALAKFPEKWSARSKLRYAVKMGRIIKPEICDTCKEHKVLHGHHEDYSKPLQVMWLCTRCHADRHKYLKANNKTTV